jgi:hypothetical protein
MYEMCGTRNCSYIFVPHLGRNGRFNSTNVRESTKIVVFGFNLIVKVNVLKDYFVSCSSRENVLECTNILLCNCNVLSLCVSSLEKMYQKVYYFYFVMYLSKCLYVMGKDSFFFSF